MRVRIYSTTRPAGQMRASGSTPSPSENAYFCLSRPRSAPQCPVRRLHPNRGPTTRGSAGVRSRRCIRSVGSTVCRERKDIQPPSGRCFGWVVLGTGCDKLTWPGDMVPTSQCTTDGISSAYFMRKTPLLLFSVPTGQSLRAGCRSGDLGSVRPSRWTAKRDDRSDEVAGQDSRGHSIRIMFCNHIAVASESWKPSKDM